MRRSFRAELDELRVQVEVMGIQVDQNLERMLEVLRHGDQRLADRAVAHDDEIDASNVSLTERCHALLALEQPVASDLRFVVSVLRILSEFERIGDLALRVVKLNQARSCWERHPAVADILLSMAETAVDAYRQALRAWSAQDLDLASALAARVSAMEHHYERLMHELLALDGPEAVRTATVSLVAGRSLERIADHAAIIGSRLRYLLTGDPDHLKSEVRPR